MARKEMLLYLGKCKSEQHWACSKNRETINAVKGLDKGLSHYWEWGLEQLSWKLVWRFLSTLKIKLPPDPAMPFRITVPGKL